MDKNPPGNAGDTGGSLIREDSTGCGTTKPMRHNYWSLKTKSPCFTTREATVIGNPHTTKKRSTHAASKDPAQPKIIKISFNLEIEIFMMKLYDVWAMLQNNLII